MENAITRISWNERDIGVMLSDYSTSLKHIRYTHTYAYIHTHIHTHTHTHTHTKVVP